MVIKTSRAARWTLLVGMSAGALVAVTGCQSSTSPAAGGSAVSSAVAQFSAPGPDAASSGTPSSIEATKGSNGEGAAGACALVTEQDATAALGAPSGPGALTTQGDATQCTYRNGALIVTTSSKGKSLYDTTHAAITAAPAGTWQDVPGLGEAAFTAHGGPVAMVTFYKGTTFVAISLAASTTPPTSAALQIATSAASRI